MGMMSYIIIQRDPLPTHLSSSLKNGLLCDSSRAKDEQAEMKEEIINKACLKKEDYFFEKCGRQDR